MDGVALLPGDIVALNVDESKVAARTRMVTAFDLTTAPPLDEAGSGRQPEARDTRATDSIAWRATVRMPFARGVSEFHMGLAEAVLQRNERIADIAQPRAHPSSSAMQRMGG